MSDGTSSVADWARRQLGRMTGAEGAMSAAAFGTLFTSLGGTAIRFVLQIALSNWLGQAAYGLFVLGRGWGELLSKVPNRGYMMTALRVLPDYEHNEEWGLYRGFVRSASRETAVGGIVLAVLAALGYGLLVPSAESAIVFGLFLAPALAVVGMYRALLQAAHQYVPATGLTELFQPVLFGVVLGGLAVATDMTAEAALVLYIGSMALTAVLEALLLRRSLPDAIHASEQRFRRKDWVATARPLFVAQLALAALQVVDLLVVGAILGAAEAALYGVATRVAVLGRVVNSGLESVVSPRISKAYASGTPGDIQGIVDQTIRISAAPTLGFALLVALAADPVLSLLGSEYVDARSVLLILLVGNVTNALTGPSGFVISMTGSEWTYAAVMGAHAVGLTVLSFWLGWTHGIVGVAIGRSLINVSWNMTLVVLARRRLDVRCYPRRTTFSRT